MNWDTTDSNCFKLGAFPRVMSITPSHREACSSKLLNRISERIIWKNSIFLISTGKFVGDNFHEIETDGKGL